MAKRHPAFVGLSHDHHHTLVLALRLRQGEEALLTDGWTDDSQQQRLRVRRFSEEDLRSHFAAEEEILFPSVERFLPSSAPLVDILRGQHRDVESLVTQLDRADETNLRALLASLGSLLEEHVRREERELFPICESGFSEDVLLSIGEEFHHVRERKG